MTNVSQFEKIPLIETIRTVFYGEGEEKQNVTQLILPRMVKAARDHFKCQEIMGINLSEDLANLEKRIFNTDIMTSSMDLFPVMSRISLSLLEDSGWYLVNYYEMADFYIWGSDAGCEIIGDCSSWTFDGSCQPSFDDEIPSQLCTANMRGYSTCEINNNPFVPDNCGIIELDMNNNGTVWCSYGEYNRTTGATYDVNSRCFRSTLIYTGAILPSLIEPNSQSLQCYNVTCKNPELAMVLIGDYWYECGTNSYITDALHYSGEIFCPPVNRLCTTDLRYETNWPNIDSVFSSSGSCDAELEILGTFDPDYNYTVVVDGQWKSSCNISFVSRTMIVCQLACEMSFSFYTTTTDLSVIVINPDGKTALARNAFLYYPPFTQKWGFQVLVPGVAFLFCASILMCVIISFVTYFNIVRGVKVLETQRRAELEQLTNLQEEVDSGTSYP
eukprot:TRINITY_DN5939_c0_g1_i3.p1 TRINITY_DN5939_c0_g1~~TRINITY_DN5939_c0_g1_i3.p1  ORF type:complete len:444 (+),score=47.39 TRINITY_DN5939_c0_g1_i3:932-2263(+)